MIYQVVHPPLPGGPWDRRWDGVVNNFTTSLQEVVNRVSWAGINDSFVKGFWQLRVNVGEVVNEMAVQTLILNIDRCSKNHYIHRTPDGRFGLIPYDVEDAFATDWRSNHAARSCSARDGAAATAAACCPAATSTASTCATASTHKTHKIGRHTTTCMMGSWARRPCGSATCSGCGSWRTRTAAAG